MKSGGLLGAIMGFGITTAGVLVLSPPVRTAEGQASDQLDATFDLVDAIRVGGILSGPSGDASLSIVGRLDDPRVTSGRITSFFEATNRSQEWAHDKCWAMANALATNPHQKYTVSMHCVGNLATAADGTEFVCISTPSCQLNMR